MISINGCNIGLGRPKICVPIVGKTEEEILSQAVSIVDQSVDLVEFRADCYTLCGELTDLLSILQKLRTILQTIPILFTIRTQYEGGLYQGSVYEYERLLLEVTKSGTIDLVDVEYNRGKDLCANILTHAKMFQVITIASYHDFNQTESHTEMKARLSQMEATGADIVKVAYMPQSAKDALNLMLTVKEYATHTTVPLVGISMGSIGEISRFCGELYHSVITFATIQGRASAPGQVALCDVIELQERLSLYVKKNH